MLLMWTLNVWKWSFEPRPSVQLFLGGNTVSKGPVCFHADIRTRSIVTSSICTTAHSQSDVGWRGGTIKTKDPDILFCHLSHLFLSWVSVQGMACSCVLWSAEKLFGFSYTRSTCAYDWQAHQLPLYLFYMATDVLCCCVSLQVIDICFIIKYLDSLLNR